MNTRVSSTKDFRVKSDADSRLIVESYVWGGAKYIIKSQVRYSVIITDFNTRGNV